MKKQVNTKKANFKVALISAAIILTLVLSSMPASAFELTLCTGDSPTSGKSIQIAPTSSIERIAETAMKDMFRIPLT